MDSIGGPPWVNSWFGRLLNSGLGGFAVGSGLWRAFWHPGWRLLDVLAASGVLLIAGAALLALTWTERLAVDGGRLVAHHFWGESSIALADITSAEAPIGITGILVRAHDGSRLRSWASMRQGNELWTTRAEKIAKAVLALVRDVQGAQAPASNPAAKVLLGPTDGARFTLVRLREGYDIAEVDAFVAQIGTGSVTSADARHVRFTPVRLRQGYDMGEVDGYVDGIAAELSAGGR